MTVDVKIMDGVAVVALSDDIDLQTSPKVRKELLRCLNQRQDVLVDMGAVSYIDSSGVASLVEGFQTARKNGTRFALVGVSGAAMRVLQLARLDKVFTIHAGLDEALKAGA